MRLNQFESRFLTNREARLAEGPSQHLAYTWGFDKKGRPQFDRKAFYVLLDKIAWNKFVRDAPGYEGRREQNMFGDVPDDQFVYTQIFRKGDKPMIEKRLHQWLDARMWDVNAHQMKPLDSGEEPDPSLLRLNVKTNWDREMHVLAGNLGNHAVGGRVPGVPDYHRRIFEGNQFHAMSEALGQLEDAYHARKQANITNFTPIPTLQFVPAVPSGMPLERASRKRKHAGLAARRKRSRVDAPAPDETPDLPLEIIEQPPSPPFGPEPPRPRRSRAPSERLSEPGMGLPFGQDWGFDWAEARGLDAGSMLSGSELRQQWAEEMEEKIEQAFGGMRPNRVSGKHELRADRVRDETYGAIHHVHLMQTDNNVQPLMGAVHMVQVPHTAHAKHFMRDVHGDVNEGQRVLKERARRGPFKNRGGPSTVMDSSANVRYRKRAGAFEITVSRGATNSELQQLLSKLSMHRMSIAGSMLIIIKGNKRYRLGRLDQLDLRKILDSIEDCLSKYGICGLEITEQTAGSGALYKGSVHGARFKSSARKGRGIAARRRADAVAEEGVAM